MSVDTEFDLTQLDSECGHHLERARRRAPISDAAAETRPPYHCNRILHDVPLYQAATDDYAYLRMQQRWSRWRAVSVSLCRLMLRVQAKFGVHVPVFAPVTIAAMLVFLAGVWVGGNSSCPR